MLFASIDIGSNAVRLLFANVFEREGHVRADKATLIRIPIRLGLDVFEHGSISAARVRKLLDTMKAFSLLIDVYEPLGVDACATAAIREAANGEEVIRMIWQETSLHIRIIDGMEEARIISSFNVMVQPDDHKHTLYIDVGGGSTEITLMSGSDFMVSQSFRIGTIRLLQGHVEEEEWTFLRNWLKHHTSGLSSLRCVGSGGNINKLTKLFGDYALNTISLNQLNMAAKRLGGLSLEERIHGMGLRPDRADVILPAANIFRKTLKWSSLQIITVPKIGLVDGLVLALYEKRRQELREAFRL